MFVFFALFGFLFIVIGIVGLLIKVIFKKPKRKFGTLALVGIAMFIVAAVIVPDDIEPEIEKADSVEQTPIDEPSETPKEAPDKETVKDIEKPEEEISKETEEKPVPVVAPPKNDSSKVTPEKLKDSTETSGTTARIPVELVKVIDGDTIKILYNGREQNVRYLLIDTPETNHPRLGKQPFGDEAKARNKELIESGTLEIEFDIGERFDKYDRLLAYIYVDGKSIQKILLSEGLARVAYVYPPNTRHVDPYEKAQAIAKEKKLGIWSVEDYATDTGFNAQVVKEKPAEPTPAPTKQPAAPAPAPAAKPTPPVQNTEWFQNCTELRKTYPNGVPSSHPAYQPKMDRDKDGFACER
ncbi:thermonuclease family protein [Sporosarcina sp. P16b]|uniref:thermonuclease family protein n=1 Tax=Sporosarcina sp. P16b TaxID=2048261 RepID=UPI001E582C06|nr:thermonuclease family protein [Sporosarcina sp. P16b]